MRKKTFYILILFILLLPTFWRMFQMGIFSMQDLHVFRVFEFDNCVRDLQIPCRWSADSSFEYGSPLFNFYGPLSYAFGELFRLVGFSNIDTLKILFSLSILLSGLTMFFLARQLWKDNQAALITSLVYTFAPYRAVDIYVRGALSECLAFIFFPLITYFFNDYVKKKKYTALLLFILSYSGLVLTHNLSALMYSFFLLFWGAYFLFKEKAWYLIPKLMAALVLIFGITSFYILPVLFEGNLVTLEKTIQGYFDFHIHFVTLNQLLISRYWDYGGSTFGTADRVSLSVGHIQWILPALIAVYLLVYFVIKRKLVTSGSFLILFSIGWFMLFLTHNKSTFIWEILPPLKYLQFPWRFLALAIFCFALASGLLVTLLKRSFMIRFTVLSSIIALLIALNTNFFFEDLWFHITDQQQFSGARYLQLTSSSINDFWPKFGNSTPISIAPKHLIFTEGLGSSKLLERRSNKANFQANIESTTAGVQVPIVYFPGWKAVVNSNPVNIYPTGNLGLITMKLNKGQSIVNLSFENSPIRTLGNLLSLISFIIAICLYIYFKKRYEN